MAVFAYSSFRLFWLVSVYSLSQNTIKFAKISQLIGLNISILLFYLLKQFSCNIRKSYNIARMHMFLEYLLLILANSFFLVDLEGNFI